MTPAKAGARSPLLLTPGLVALLLNFVVGTVWKANGAAGFLLGLAVVCPAPALLFTAGGKRRGG